MCCCSHYTVIISSAFHGSRSGPRTGSVVSKPRGRVGSGQEVIEMGQIGSGQEMFNPHGSGQVALFLWMSDWYAEK